MKTVLVTGFEPFGGETLNPSALVAKALDGRQVADRLVAGRVLPCVFGKSLAAIELELKRTQPELVICTGLAGGRAEITVERVAINIEDADIPDNEGNQPVDHPVIPGCPAAYWSTLPIKAIVAALGMAGLPAAISQSAGTYVCNHVFYGLMHRLAGMAAVRGGFIHVPYMPEQTDGVAMVAPSLPLDQIIRGVELAIETSLTTQQDLRVAGGATC
jgi:pyroglutamyl-peptidase